MEKRSTVRLTEADAQARWEAGGAQVVAQRARSQGKYAREGGRKGAVGDVRGRECGANWTRRDARRVGGRGGMASELCAVREEGY